MVCGSKNNHICWERINLQEKRTDDSLYLSRLMDVTALLSDNVKLVKEKDTLSGPYLLEETAKSDCGFT
jgi:hypothetical protein